MNEFTTIIQRTVSALLKEVEQPSDELRLQYTRVLCTGSTYYLDARGYNVLSLLGKRNIINDDASEEVTNDDASEDLIDLNDDDANEEVPNDDASEDLIDLTDDHAKEEVINDDAREDPIDLTDDNAKEEVTNDDGNENRIDDDANANVTDTFAAAAHVGNTSLLKKLIDEGVDIDAESGCFGRALRGAAFGGHRDAVLLLLDHGADANLGSRIANARLQTSWKATALNCGRESTALQAAARRGHERIVRLLLKPKYQVVAKGNDYKRAILHAARGGHSSLLQALIDIGKIKKPEELQQWILVEACHYGHEPIIQMMLDLDTNLNDVYRGEEHEWVGSVAKSPLRIAASHNFHNIVQLLLANGADPNKIPDTYMDDEYADTTPLHDAVQGGYERVAQTLLDHGADINAGKFHSPLDVAVRRGTLEMVRFLLERGASLDTETQASKGQAFLAAAADRGHEPMVRLLVTHGASVDEVDEEPNQAMLCAMRAGHDHVVQTLIELGAKKLESLPRGYTPVVEEPEVMYSGCCPVVEPDESEEDPVLEDPVLVNPVLVAAPQVNEVMYSGCCPMVEPDSFEVDPVTGFSVTFWRGGP